MDFKGYKDNASQTKKKILTDVFTKGDTWFRTGDLIRKDAYGYMYFVDRIGDTFRWKGENVSTIEVSNCFSSYAGIEEANVYGVSVPNADGRAGMAALVVTTEFQINGLAAHLRKSLPFYAVPVFLRFVKQMTATSTMKQVKHELVKEGIQPEAVKGDELWYLAPKAKDYTRFTAEEYAAVEKGAVRL